MQEEIASPARRDTISYKEQCMNINVNTGKDDIKSSTCADDVWFSSLKYFSFIYSHLFPEVKTFPWWHYTGMAPPHESDSWGEVMLSRQSLYVSIFLLRRCWWPLYENQRKGNSVHSKDTTEQGKSQRRRHIQRLSLIELSWRGYPEVSFHSCGSLTPASFLGEELTGPIISNTRFHLFIRLTLALIGFFSLF